MKRLIVPLVLLAMGGVLAVAVAVDCARLAADYQYRVGLADAELRKHEQRFVGLVDGRSGKSAAITADIGEFRSAGDPAARHAAYERLVTSFRQSALEFDATNPVDRKFMDETTGAMNRRDVAEKPYDEEWAAYQRFLGTWRGGVARWFSSNARADWQTLRP
jgi:hypothetical protein